MRIAYHRLVEVDEVMRRIEELSPRTVLFDVEPLVAYWDTDSTTLANGVAAVLRRVSTFAGIRVIGFTTNSSRDHSIEAGVRNPDAFYLTSARKPLRIGPYQDLPEPGLVVGDQIATDGVLAWRLGYSFIHYRPQLETPLGPRLMRLAGQGLRPLLFTAPDRDQSAEMSASTYGPA